MELVDNKPDLTFLFSVHIIPKLLKLDFLERRLSSRILGNRQNWNLRPRIDEAFASEETLFLRLHALLHKFDNEWSALAQEKVSHRLLVPNKSCSRNDEQHLITVAHDYLGYEVVETLVLRWKGLNLPWCLTLVFDPNVLLQGCLLRFDLILFFQLQLFTRRGQLIKVVLFFFHNVHLLGVDVDFHNFVLVFLAYPLQFLRKQILFVFRLCDQLISHPLLPRCTFAS